MEGSYFESLNPIRLGCANCSARGEMITTSGKIRLDVGARLSGEDDDIVKDGFVKLEINGFDMSIGLKAVLSVPIKKTYEILTLTPVGFRVCVPIVNRTTGG